MQALTKPVPSDLQIALTAVEEFEEQAVAAKTKETYAWAIRDFRRWAFKHGIDPERPTRPDFMAAWLAQSAKEGLAPASIDIMRAALDRAHTEEGFDPPGKDPLVRRVVAGIRRVKGVAPKAQKNPLLAQDVVNMIRAMPLKDPLRVRDKALLLLGFAGGFRRSELARLTVADIVFSERGAVVTLRKSKTDQEGRGRTVAIRRSKGAIHNQKRETCPVAALEEWLRLKPATPTLFEIGGRMISNIIKKRAAAAGIDPKTVSGHSLRAGFVTQAARDGKSEAVIARTTGHRDVKTLRGYVRHADPFEGT
jgi:integrase